MAAPKTTAEDAFEDSRTLHMALNRREFPVSACGGRDGDFSSTSVVVAVGSTDQGSCYRGLL